MATPTEEPKVRGPKLSAHQIIVKPIVSEKGTHTSQHRRAYPFEVNPWATKDEIKAAAEELFGVRVEKVRTANRLGKRRRYRFRIGRLANWKKAIITLRPDSPAIEFF